jgi:hypothetical protein
MKRYSALLLTLLALAMALGQVNAQCKSKDIVKKWKGDLSPFEYDSFVIDDFQYKSEKQLLDMEFTALSGLEYKLVFCTSNLPQPVGITIYDKPKTDKKRKPIYFDESSKDGFLCSFRAERTGTFYIEYEVPVGDQKNLATKNCVLMLIGISEK